MYSQGCSIELRTKILQHFIKRSPSVGDLKIFPNYLVTSEHKISSEVKVTQNVQKPKGNKCKKCKRLGHSEPDCSTRILKYCKKFGHLKDQCFQNSDCSSYKHQHQTDPRALGETHIIEGVVDDYAKDDLVEEVICGQLKSISDSVDFLYMTVSASRALSRGDSSSVSSCADTGSGNSFAPEALFPMLLI